jgi:hypothetical protein
MKTVEAVPSRGRHWLIWPTDATEWMLTYSEDLAKKAKQYSWGCIEYAEVVESPEVCTPADALVLRQANHALVDELQQARQLLADACAYIASHYEEGYKQPAAALAAKIIKFLGEPK